MDFESQQSQVAYLKALVAAGLEGLTSARHARNDRVVEEPLASSLWTMGAAGGMIGAASARLFGKRKTVPAAVMGGLVGSIAGCGVAVAWASRGFFVPAGRCVTERVNTVRDERWLAMNPIDYA